jgi:hypothetical protein
MGSTSPTPKPSSEAWGRGLNSEGEDLTPRTGAPTEPFVTWRERPLGGNEVLIRPLLTQPPPGASRWLLGSIGIQSISRKCEGGWCGGGMLYNCRTQRPKDPKNNRHQRKPPSRKARRLTANLRAGMEATKARTNVHKVPRETLLRTAAQQGRRGR